MWVSIYGNYYVKLIYYRCYDMYTLDDIFMLPTAPFRVHLVRHPVQPPLRHQEVSETAGSTRWTKGRNASWRERPTADFYCLTSCPNYARNLWFIFSSRAKFTRSEWKCTLQVCQFVVISLCRSICYWVYASIHRCSLRPFKSSRVTPCKNVWQLKLWGPSSYSYPTWLMW